MKNTYCVRCQINGLNHNIHLCATSIRHAAIRVRNRYHSSRVTIIAIVPE